MRIFLFLLISGLLCATFWFRRQEELTQKQLAASSDSLAQLILHYKTSGSRPELDSITGPKPALNDTLIEVHRIVWRPSFMGFSFRIKETKAHNIWLEYKRFNLKNPLTGAGETKVYFTKTIPVPEETFNRFRRQLASVTFFDASVDEDDMMCCWATGSLEWDARFPNNQFLRHSTYCRQSVQFAEACEIIMRVVDDPELLGALGVSAKH